MSRSKIENFKVILEMMKLRNPVINETINYKPTIRMRMLLVSQSLKSFGIHIYAYS